MSEHWLGSRTSDLPILVSVYDDTPELAREAARRIEACYPAEIHGTSVVEPVKVMTGLWKCNVYLVPGKNGDPALWLILKSKEVEVV